MLIAHISDFHLFSDRPESALVRADATEAARKLVADIAAFTPAVEAVMLTGDLVDGGTEEDYALLKDVLSPLSVPVFVIPGNHDRRATMRAAFADRLPFAAGTYLNYEASHGDLRILALDTLIEGKVEGRLAEESLDWLEDRLDRAHAGPTLVLMHHPPFDSGIGAMDRRGLVEGGERLARLVRAYSGSLRILSGHVHRPYQAIWNGVLCTVAGSPAFQIGLDLDGQAAKSRPVQEPFAYFIHRLDAVGGVVVHARYVDL